MTRDQPTSPDSALRSIGSTSARFASVGLWSLTLLLLVAGVTLRWRQHDRQPLDFDEYLHLHLAWCWTQDQVPGVDYWDNHLPLLHLLLATLQPIGGETIATIYVARGAMLVISLGILAATYLLARIALGARTGWAAAALLACVQVFTEKTAEVRPDAGMILFVVLAVTCILKAGQARTARVGGWYCFAAGATLGVALLFSTKTLMLLAALVPALGIIAWRQPSRPQAKKLLFQAAWAAFGLAASVAPLLIFLASRGALADLLRFSVVDNLRFADRVPPWRWLQPSWSTPLALVFVAGGVQAAVNQFRKGDDRDAQMLLLVIAAVLVALFVLIMPSPYAHSACLFIPFLAVLGGHLLRSAIDWAGDGSRHSGKRLAGGLIALLILLPGMGDSLLRLQLAHTGDRAALNRQIEVVRETLAITAPGDRVFADTPIPIFRQHACFYPALWDGVVNGFESGKIEPPIREHLRRYGCTLIVRRLPARVLPTLDGTFIESHFVPYRPSLLVPGRHHPAERFADGMVIFDAVTAGRYTIYSDAQVWVDGLKAEKDVHLEAGRHEIVCSPPVADVTLIRKPGQ
ncbi:MAG: glycosyltransferase family 39 protein [Planctomycetes bacterium]|nr:glycosyltransferase family 39 protein [Planctomycetota bacterium]